MQKELPPEEELIPSRDNILIRSEKAKDVTKGGLHLPDKAKGDPRVGVIVSLGPDCTDFYRAGDRVMLPMAGGADVKLNEETFKIIPEYELLGKIERVG